MGQITEIQVGKIEEPEAAQEITPRVTSRRPQTGKKRWKKILLLAVVAVVLIGLVIFGIVWSKRGVVTVQTGKVVPQDLTSIVTANGQIQPPQEKRANVNAEGFGQITAIYVKEGDAVKKGQVLLRTDNVQQSAEVDVQQAALGSAQADVQGLEAGVNSADANLKSAQADALTAEANFNKAKDDYARGQQLLKDQLIAQEVFDQRRNAYEVALSSVKASQAHVAQAQSQYQASLVRATDVRNKTIYPAPLTGIVTSLPVHVGENVVPGIQNQVGSVLFQVSDLSVITAQVNVDETDIVNIKLGQPADVAIDAVQNKTFKGKVTEIGQSAISPTTGVASGQSGAASEEAKDFKVVITLDDPPPGMRPGLSATAKITTATRPNALTIPIQALTIWTRRELEEASKPESAKAATLQAPTLTAKEKEKQKEEVQGVFALEKDRVKFMPVKTGIMGTTDMEILEGVKPGDTIVTGSYQALRTLKSGTKVKVDNTPIGPAPGTGK
ncbi:MAG: secretion protein HlyD [Acidobacteria bacterium]|nr:MAG: secretion protein HlyD [Acidobacteriota bacterium]